MSGIQTILCHLQEVLSSLSKSNHGVNTGMVCVLVDCQVQYQSAIHTLLCAQLLCAAWEFEGILQILYAEASTPRMTKDSIAHLSPPALQKPLVMKEAYIFSDSANKFTAHLGTNQRSLNKVIATFLSAPTCPILEFSLSMFDKLYQDLPLAKVIAHNESEHCDEQ